MSLFVFMEKFLEESMDKCDPGSFKTQKGPNYGSGNDFAFFDMIVDGKPIYVETLLTSSQYT